MKHFIYNNFTKFINNFIIKLWFTKNEIKNLKKLGYIVFEYILFNVIKGETQVLFIPEPFKERRLLPIEILVI